MDVFKTMKIINGVYYTPSMEIMYPLDEEPVMRGHSSLAFSLREKRDQYSGHLERIANIKEQKNGNRTR